MAFDRFLIAPFNTGLQTDLRPFLIMDDAFTYLQNAYVFRGRVRKRFGSLFMGTNQLESRLSTSLFIGGNGIGITDSTGAASGNVRTILADSGLPLAIGQTFSIGTQLYNVISSTAGAQPMLTSSGSGTFNISTGAYTITGGPADTTIYFYPSLPVMGLTQYESGIINDHPSYAFDTRYAYVFTPGSGWDRSGTAIWHGNNLKYFWATNWQGSVTNANTGVPVMFVTNFNWTPGAAAPAATDDPIWYMSPAGTWVAMLGSPNGIFFLPNPTGSSPLAPYTGPFVQTALMIVVFKNRLVLLNTVENNNSGYNPTGPVYSGTATHYKNRARYCFLGSPLAINAWYETGKDSSGNVAAGAGYEDCPTEEAIISSEFVKDRLIVYFERSTWEFAYTGIDSRPFVWQKLNTELGSQGVFSTVPFDRECLTIGNTGIHACNGSNVARIDTKIPDEVFDAFKIKNDSPKRIQGIRDYYTELVYWCFVNTAAEPTQVFANQILVYNYQNKSWALNDDCFTAFGYFEQQADETWESSAPQTWEEFPATWIDGIIQAQQRQIIAGTPEGFVLRIVPDNPFNAPSMQITNLIPSVVVPGGEYFDLTVINHNCAIGDFVSIQTATGITYPTGYYQVFGVIDVNNITIYAKDLTGTYTGGGTLARVSNIQFTTKQINPYDKDGSDVYLARVDFMVEKTDYGQITVDYAPSSTELSMINEAQSTNSIMGTGVLETYAYPAYYYPLEQNQQRLVHPIYFQTTGTCVQLNFYQTPTQLGNANIATSDFQLDAITLFCNKSGRMQ